MEKTKLIVVNGYGSADVGERKYVVVQAGGLWNLGVQHRGGGYMAWAKENVKRISTLQRFADGREYGIQIEMED